MELSYIVVTIVIVIIVSLGLAIASNRSEEVKQPIKNQRAQRSKSKQTQKKGNTKKPVKDVKFGGDGKNEDEDKSMLELINGTMKFAKQEAKEQAKKIKSAANAEAEKIKQTGKNLKKKAADLVAEDETEYTTIKPRKTKGEKDGNTPDESSNQGESKGKKGAADSNASVGDNETNQPQRVRKPREPKKKPFLKSDVVEIVENKQKRERKPRDENRQVNNNDQVEGATSSDDKERKPRKPRAPKPAGENQTVEGQEGEKRPPRQPREPREPRKPREVQPLPTPLAITPSDIPSLDDMLGAISFFYGTTTKKNFFSGMDKSALTAILSFLNPQDLAKLARVNHFLSKITREDSIWKNLCVRDFNMQFGKKSERKKFKPIYRDEFEKIHGKRERNTKKSSNNNNNTSSSTTSTTSNTSTTENTPSKDQANDSTTNTNAQTTGEKKKRERKPKDV